MEELIIYRFQAESIENTLRLVANLLESHSKETCLDRDIMQDWQYIKNILEGKPEERVNRM